MCRHEARLAAVVQQPGDPEHLQLSGHRIPSIAAGKRMWGPRTIVRGVMGWGRGVLSRAVALCSSKTPRLEALS